MKSLDTCPGSLLLGRGLYADDHDGFAELLHAVDHVLRAGRAPIPERQEHVACLRHLVVAAHASAFPKALPIGAEELMPDGVLPGPAVAELVSAFGTAGDDLRDAMALRCQRLAQQLIVGKRPWASIMASATSLNEPPEHSATRHH